MRISDWSSDVCSSDLTITEKVDTLACRPNIRSPSHTDAAMMNGVVTGLDRKVIAAPIGILARNGSASRATPNLCTPGIRKKMPTNRSEEHTSELQSLMRISYAVFCLKKKKNNSHN